MESAFHKDNWHQGVSSVAQRNGIKSRRWGMRTTIYQGASAGHWVLEYGHVDTNIYNDANWFKVADLNQTWGGGGGGVNIYNSDGTLTGQRELDGGGFGLTFTNTVAFNIETDVMIAASNGNIEMTAFDVMSLGAVNSFGLATSIGNMTMYAGSDGLFTASAGGNASPESEPTLQMQTPYNPVGPIGAGSYILRSGPYGQGTGAVSSVLGGSNITDTAFLNLSVVDDVSGYGSYINMSGNTVEFANAIQMGSSGNIDVSSGKDMNINADGVMLITADSNMTITSTAGDIYVNSSALLDLFASNAISLNAGTTFISMTAAGYIDGTGNDYVRMAGGTSPIAPVLVLDRTGAVNPNTIPDFAGLYVGDPLLFSTFAGLTSYLASGGSEGFTSIEGWDSSGTRFSGVIATSLSTDGLRLYSTEHIALEFNLTADLLIDNDPGTAGYAILSQGPGLPPVWGPVGGGGSPASPTRSIQINDAGSFGSDGILIPTTANMTFGESTTAGATRSITADGSAANISFTYTTKGTGLHQFVGDINMGVSGTTTGTTRTLTAAGSSANINLSLQSKGTGNLVLGGSQSSQIVIGSGIGDPIVALATGTAPSAGTINTNNFSTTNRITFNYNGTNNGEAAFIASTTEYGFVGTLSGRNFVLAAVGGNTSAGVGGNIELRAGQGGTPGNGGNLILQPGLPGTGGGNAGYIIMNNLPTSSAGLPAGALWNNAGVLNIA